MANFSANTYVSPPMLQNPFISQAPSRVTASGFTESTIVDDVKSKIDSYINVVPMSRNDKRRDSVMQDDMTDITAKIRGLNVNKASTIIPQDSVSQINPGGRIHNQLSPIDETGSCMFNSVIAGYAQTSEEKLDEIDAISNIQKIAGLPIIFTNSRLNFLIHLHKPLQSMLSRDGHYPVESSLREITSFISKYRGKHRDPHSDLLYQVIRTTMNDGKVRSNPFNLPLLEVGMKLTDQLIYMCFMQLYNEYQIEWFKSMKDIEAPKFHNKFHNFKAKSREKTVHPPTGKRRHTSGSIISSSWF